MKSRGSQINLCWENHLQVPITVSAELLGLLLCAESCRKSQESKTSCQTSGASACGPSQKETTKTIALLAVRPLQVPGGTGKWNLCVCVSKHCRTFQNPLFGHSYRNKHMMRVRGSFSILYIVLSSAWLELTQWLNWFKNTLKHFLYVSDLSTQDNVSLWNVFKETFELLYTLLNNGPISSLLFRDGYLLNKKHINSEKNWL